MTPRLFERRPSFQPPSAAWQDFPDGASDDVERKDRAVTTLLRHGVLSHTFGADGEYEVRTTLETHRGWQYQCCVLRHGKAIKNAFIPIVVDGTQQLQRVHKEPGAAAAMRLSFLKEAVEAHFARCAALREYVMMSMIYAQSPLPSRRSYPWLALLIGAAFLMVYGFWKYVPWTGSGQLPASPTPPIQRAQHSVGDRHSSASPSGVPRDVLNGRTSRDGVDEPAYVSPIPRPPETPRAVQLVDLLALQSERLEGVGALFDLSDREVIRQVQSRLRAVGFHPGPIDGHVGPRTEGALLAYQDAHRLPKTGKLDEVTLRSLDVIAVPGQADQRRRPFTAGIPAGSTASDVHAGDLLLLTGWLHQVSRDSDGAYLLQLSPHQKASAPALMAVVPHPDHISGSPTMRAQLQTVRTFIRGRLLRQQEPSPRGSVMRSPPFVQLSGQLSSLDAPFGDPPQPTGSRHATAHWELRPVLEIEFTTPPPP